MLAVIGTYRKRDYIERCLASIAEHVTGITETVIVDDSGDAEHSEWLSQFGRVVAVGGRGYNAAMQAIVGLAADRQMFFVEEDFTFTASVNLDQIGRILSERPHLAQLALLRQSWFPIEHRKGGVIEALKSRGYRFDVVDDLIEHTATFTCNPAVWSELATSTGWPAGDWSEDAKRDELLNAGLRMAYLPGIRVHHDGIRSGHGY